MRRVKEQERKESLCHLHTSSLLQSNLRTYTYSHLLFIQSIREERRHRLSFYNCFNIVSNGLISTVCVYFFSFGFDLNESERERLTCWFLIRKIVATDRNLYTGDELIYASIEYWQRSTMPCECVCDLVTSFLCKIKKRKSPVLVPFSSSLLLFLADSAICNGSIPIPQRYCCQTDYCNESLSTFSRIGSTLIFVSLLLLGTFYCLHWISFCLVLFLFRWKTRINEARPMTRKSTQKNVFIEKNQRRIGWVQRLAREEKNVLCSVPDMLSLPLSLLQHVCDSVKGCCCYSSSSCYFVAPYDVFFCFLLLLLLLSLLLP